MSNKLRYKPWVTYTLYAAGLIAIIGLLGIARNYSKNKKVAALNIEIQNAQTAGFITNQDIERKVKEIYPGITSGAVVQQINTRIIEKILRNDLWISTAQVFFNRKNELVIKVAQAQPTVRVVTTIGKHYYIDTMGKWMPLQYQVASRLPIITNYPVQQNGTPKNDSVLKAMLIAIGKVCVLDSFWQSQLSQVNIDAHKKLTITPTLGNHTIYLGTCADIPQKLLRLKRFYTQYTALHGLQMYEKLDAQYDKQIVAVKRGEKAVFIKDSLGIRAAMGTFDSSAVVPATPVVIDEVVDGDDVPVTPMRSNSNSATSSRVPQLPVNRTNRSITNNTQQTNRTTNRNNITRPQQQHRVSNRPAQTAPQRNRTTNRTQTRNTH
jgi:cell division protein FtsQ